MGKQRRGDNPRRGDNEGFDKPVVGRLEPRKSMSAFNVVFDRETKKVLLVHKFDELPSWGLPGGGVESGETAEEAIYRETLIETGYTVTGVPTLVLEYQINQRHEKFIFTSSVDTGHRREIGETEEIDRAEWFPLQEIMDMPHVPYKGEERDPDEQNYIKGTHRDYILDVLSQMNLLEESGFREAVPGDFVQDC